MQMRHMLRLGFDDALASGKFEFHYQPIVNLKENRITSAEALIRWRHPERGLILPNEFIPVAEESDTFSVLVSGPSTKPAPKLGSGRTTSKSLSIFLRSNSRSGD